MVKPVRRRGTAAEAEAGFDLMAAPGHLLRRAQQRAVEIYLAEVGEAGPTPPQFALLTAIRQNPGANQVDLVRMTGIDRSTLADMVARLIKRGLIRRRRAAHDRRVNELALSEEGAALLAAVLPAVQRAQVAMLVPLPPGQRAAFLRALQRIANSGTPVGSGGDRDQASAV